MRTKKKFPSYDIKSPKFPPLRLLYDNLAYQDASFQANQVAIEFLDTYIDDNKLSGKDFIHNLSSKYQISAGTDDILRIKEMMAESYIVQTYHIAELFFKEFNRVYKKINTIEDWKTEKTFGKSKKKLDPLNQLLLNIDTSKRKTLNNLPEFYLANYYRLLRNGYVHREIKKSISLKKPKAYYDKNIVPFQAHFEKYYKHIPKAKAPAPNYPEEITHRDFVLYSRVLRNLANYLNDLCDMSVLQALEIAKRDNKFLRTPKLYNYHKFPNNKKKVDIYLEGYYKTHFGNSANQITEFKRLFYQKH